MASRYEQWANRPVTRDHLGRFAESAAAHARRLLADAAIPGRSVSRMFREGARPEGFEHLAGRALYLGDIPAEPRKGGLGRSRTDEEHEEYELIAAAILKYNESIGLGPASQYSSYRRKFADAHEVYDPFGNYIENTDPDLPRAARLGYVKLGVNDDGETMWVRPGVSPYREIYSDSGRTMSQSGTPYATRPSRRQKWDRTDARMAEFTRDKYGDQVEMYTRQASKPGKEKYGPIGGRGNKETDFRAVMKYVDQPLNKRLRQSKGKKKRQRTWIEKLNVRMQRGEA